MIDKQLVISRLNRFKKIDEITNCWLFNGALTDGYGALTIESKTYRATRLSLFAYKDFDLDSSKQALHILECSNPQCFNPEHLYSGTAGNNTQDSIKLNTHKDLGKVNREKTHCKKGHEFTKENTGHYQIGKRYCKACNRGRTKK